MISKIYKFVAALWNPKLAREELVSRYRFTPRPDSAWLARVSWFWDWKGFAFVAFSLDSDGRMSGTATRSLRELRLLVVSARPGVVGRILPKDEDEEEEDAYYESLTPEAREALLAEYARYGGYLMTSLVEDV